MKQNDDELDFKLKQELKNKLTPSDEFKKKISEMVEEEKQKHYTESKKEFKQIENTQKRRKFKLSTILSMVAVFIVVFTLGVELRTAEITSDGEKAILTRITAIEPTKCESGILANDSEFTIYVEGDNLNTEAVQRSIYVEPALEYTIEKTLNKNEYKLQFQQNIPDNTIVKLQYVKDQITQDSWAYQTSNKLSITSTYPQSGEKSVSKKTVIEVEFSYANVKNFE